MPLHHRLSFDLEAVERAVETVREALKAMEPGPLLRGPGPEGPVDVAVLYMGVAVDRVHVDLERGIVSPKGAPVHHVGAVNEDKAVEIVANALREAVVLEGAELRAPERAWIVPVAWHRLIFLHVRVSLDGSSIIGDPGLTAEIRRRLRV